MNEITVNVIGNVIAWPIIIALAFAIRKSWRFLRKIDTSAAQEIRTNVPFRTAASATAVSEIIMGCTAILIGVAWLFLTMVLRVDGLLLEMNATTLHAVSNLAGFKNLTVQLFKDIGVFEDGLSPYPGYVFLVCGVFIVFIGRRVLSHLTRATESK